MDRPGVLEWASLLLGGALAFSPAGLALRLLLRGSLFEGGVYLVAAVVVFLLPFLLVRRLPGPRWLVQSCLDRLKRRIQAIFPWTGND